jgi:hypothetical protein
MRRIVPFRAIVRSALPSTSEVISLIRPPLGWYGLLEKPGMLGHWNDYHDPQQRTRRFFPTGESHASSPFHFGCPTFDLHTSPR